MPSIEEIDSWTLQDIRTEIDRLLPAGVSFRLDAKEGWMVAVIHQGDDIYWTDQGADRRLLHLSAFGWLWTRGKKAGHPAWQTKHGADPARPNHRPPPGVAPDPPDIDPETLNRMYTKPKA